MNPANAERTLQVLVALALAVSGMHADGFGKALASAIVFIGKPLLLFDSILDLPRPPASVAEAPLPCTVDCGRVHTFQGYLFLS